MPHPLSGSFCLAALMESHDSVLKSRPHTVHHKDPRPRRSSERLLVKVCKNAIVRSSKATLIPSSVTKPADETPRSRTRDACLSSRLPTRVRSTATRTLPLEFLDMIITQHLGEDMQSLKSLSLTCRHFASKVQPILFHRLDVSIHPTLGRRRGSTLCQLLSFYRHLIPYVKDVRLHSLFSEDSRHPELGADKDALRVLINLPFLTKLTIHGYNNRSWNLIPRNVQLAIKTGLRGKNVSSVEVQAMSDFPVYLLEGCRSLRSLSLAVASISCYPTTDSDGVAKKTMTFPLNTELLQPSPIYLERLVVSTPTPQFVELTNWLLSDKCSLNVTRARKLHVRQRGQYSFSDHLTSVSHLLSACNATLEELEMDAYTPGHTVAISTPLSTLVGGKLQHTPDDRDSPSPTVEDLYKLVDIASLKSLRRISVTFGIQSLYDQHKHLRLLAQMFRNINRVPGCKLEEVGLFLWASPNPNRKRLPECSLSQKLVGSGSWNQLDRILSMMDLEETPSKSDDDRPSGCDVDRDRLPGIKRLKIQLSAVQDRDEAANLMAICLPRLTAKGAVLLEQELKCINL